MVPLARAMLPIIALPKAAITPIMPHAPSGMRFHQAACVFSCKLNTSFIRDTTKAVTGVGCLIASAHTGGSKLHVNLRCIAADLLELLFIAGFGKPNSLIE